MADPRILTCTRRLGGALAVALVAAACSERPAPSSVDVWIASAPMSGGSGHVFYAGATAPGTKPPHAQAVFDDKRLRLVGAVDAKAALAPVLGGEVGHLAKGVRTREAHFNRLDIRLSLGQSDVDGGNLDARLKPGFALRDTRSRPEHALVAFMPHVDGDDARSLSLRGVAGASMAAYGDLLAARFVEHTQASSSSSVDERRAALRALLETGSEVKTPVPLQEQRAGAFLVQDVVLPTPSGTEGRARCVAVAGDGQRPGLLYLNGHFMRDANFNRMLFEAAAEGFVACGVELHNYGSARADGGRHHFAHYLTLAGMPAIRSFLEEARAGLALLHARADVDKSRVGVAGASMGALLSVHVGALWPDDVDAVAAVAGTTDFDAYVHDSGSDAEQHSAGFAAWGGMEALTPLVAPTPLLLLFPEGDRAHGRAQSARVVDATTRAYAPQGGKLEVADVAGRHDQGPAKRRAVLDFMKKRLRPKASGQKVPAQRPALKRGGPFVPLLDVAKAALSEAPAVPPVAPRLDPAPFDGAPQRVDEGELDDVLYALPAGNAGEATLSTTLWHLRHPKPKGRVLVVDDGGRPAAAFALALRRCGLEVFVHEPRTFGTAAHPRTLWRRMWLTSAAVSLGEPLGAEVVRDLATAERAAETLAGAPVDVVWTSGVDVGAAALLAKDAGALARAHLVVSAGPGALRTMAKDALYPPWTAVIPGLLKRTDLDEIARAHAKSLTVTSALAGLVDGAKRPRDPVSARAAGARAVLSRFGQARCLTALTAQAGRKQQAPTSAKAGAKRPSPHP